ncbi:glycosyltransferase [Prevotella sp. KH2C16]|uniref:glycosyltransferase n=1 Tax=Prevotella sp. KH2C16 TaxID=1855325 RepID=UPI0008E1A826|nr:glycosyltransferase [Prevotella sp. KH2C16]SFG53433.1 Glycosyltransferase involved in cell wall bisynthesis [Prevotella sp. KH2C16]
MTKILIDGSIIHMEDLYKSLSIWIFRYLDSIDEKERIRYKILVLEETAAYMKKRYPQFEFIVYNPYSLNLSSNRIKKFFQRNKLYKKVVENSNCDILFVPNDLVTFSSVKVKLRKVTVVHDMKSINNAPKLSIQYLSNLYYYNRLLAHSDKVVAISKYTKEDILRFFPRKYEKKIEVIYNSVEISEQGIEDVRYNYTNYILFVNTLMPYKNVMTFLKGFALLKEKIKQKVIIVGRTTDYWSSNVMGYIKAAGIDERIIHLENLSEAELIWLYKHADLFVTTSLKEGFGYTPIEAAMCCCPVVSSTCEALADTSKGLLHYYGPPMDAEALSKVMEETLSMPQSKEELLLIANNYNEAYSREKQIKLYTEIFNRL